MPPPFPSPAALSAANTLHLQQEAYVDYQDELRDVQEAELDVAQARAAFNNVLQYMRSIGSNHFPHLEYNEVLEEMRELAEDKFDLQQAKQLYDFYLQNSATNSQNQATILQNTVPALNPVTAPQNIATIPQNTAPAVNLQNSATNPQNLAAIPQNTVPALNLQNPATSPQNIATIPQNTAPAVNLQTQNQLNHQFVLNKANREYVDDLQDVQEAQQEVAQARIEFVTALQIWQSTRIGLFPTQKYQKLHKKMLKLAKEMGELKYSKQFLDYLNQQ